MRHYYEKRNLFYIQKHSGFLTHRCAQDSFEVRRRAPRRGARSIRHASGVALGTFQTFNTCQFVESVINNSFFYIMGYCTCAIVRVKHW